MNLWHERILVPYFVFQLMIWIWDDVTCMTLAWLIQFVFQFKVYFIHSAYSNKSCESLSCRVISVFQLMIWIWDDVTCMTLTWLIQFVFFNSRFILSILPTQNKSCESLGCKAISSKPSEIPSCHMCDVGGFHITLTPSLTLTPIQSSKHWHVIRCLLPAN